MKLEISLVHTWKSGKLEKTYLSWPKPSISDWFCESLIWDNDKNCIIDEWKIIIRDCLRLTICLQNKFASARLLYQVNSIIIHPVRIITIVEEDGTVRNRTPATINVKHRTCSADTLGFLAFTFHGLSVRRDEGCDNSENDSIMSPFTTTYDWIRNFPQKSNSTKTLVWRRD